MKTVIEWFDTLPEPYKTQAINNTKLHLLKTFDESLIDAIKSSFTWHSTDQGHDYWFDLVNQIDSGTIKTS